MSEEAKGTSESRVDEILLTPQQVMRVKRALDNVNPFAKVLVKWHPKGVVIETLDSRQRWHIGPRGGSF